MFSKLAFTLVELIIVIAIIAVLSVVAFVNFSSQPIKMKNDQSAAELKVVKEMINTQKIKQQGYPTNIPHP